MTSKLRWLVCVLMVGMGWEAVAASGKVLKVLPHFLDLKGRHSLSPSLYDRDAYQAWLREHPEERSGLRFDVQYRALKTSAPRLRVELRSIKDGRPQNRVVETEVKKTTILGRWAKVAVAGDEYRELGEISAWRVTLWDGGTLLGERRSFLWPADLPTEVPPAPKTK